MKGCTRKNNTNAELNNNTENKHADKKTRSFPFPKLLAWPKFLEKVETKKQMENVTCEFAAFNIGTATTAAAATASVTAAAAAAEAAELLTTLSSTTSFKKLFIRY